MPIVIGVVMNMLDLINTLNTNLKNSINVQKIETDKESSSDDDLLND